MWRLPFPRAKQQQQQHHHQWQQQQQLQPQLQQQQQEKDLEEQREEKEKQEEQRAAPRQQPLLWPAAPLQRQGQTLSKLLVLPLRGFTGRYWAWIRCHMAPAEMRKLNRCRD